MLIQAFLPPTVASPATSTMDSKIDVAADQQQQPTKKRSSSEESPPSWVKTTKRSASLQLESSHNKLQQQQQPLLLPQQQPQLEPQKQQQQQAQPIVNNKRKPSWFFVGPVRLVAPKRAPNEDEGFDSFHGNNSSPSDGENEAANTTITKDEADCCRKPARLQELATKVVEAIEAKKQTLKHISASLVGNHVPVVDGLSVQRSRSDVEPCETRCRVQEIKDDSVPCGKLRQRRNVAHIALKLMAPPVLGDQQAYCLPSESECERPARNKTSDKCVTIISIQMRRNNSTVAGESSYQSSCESDGDGQPSLASPSYKLLYYLYY